MRCAGSSWHEAVGATTALYDVIGRSYTEHRRPDPRIALQIIEGLGDARTVLNVGAGTGSYEPADRRVVAVEPSMTMIRQREAGPVVQAAAESLPFADASFDAAMALITVHHWSDWRRGLAEMRRVAARVVVLTFEPQVHDRFWLIHDYVPGAGAGNNGPAVCDIAGALDATRVDVVPVPLDCTDGFNSAYWCRPEAYLDPSVRACISGLARLADAEIAPAMARLADDLRTGAWHERYRELLDRDTFDGGWRLIVG